MSRRSHVAAGNRSSEWTQLAEQSERTSYSHELVIEPSKEAPTNSVRETSAIIEITETNRVFTKFPELPTELQMEIWEASIPGGRLVALWLKTWRIDGGIAKEMPEDHHKFLCKNPPPTLLHITRLSRDVALKHFSLQIRTPIQKCPIYISPDLDTVYTYNFIASADERFKNIRHLAIPFSNSTTLRSSCSDGLVGGPGVTDLIGRFRKMPRLLDVTFVNHHTRCFLHVDEMFKTVNFSNWREPFQYFRMMDLAMDVSLEKHKFPNWKEPKFYEKRLDMPDGKLNCFPPVRNY